MDDKNLVNGNTALAPKRKPYYPNRDEEYEKLKKEKEERRKAQILKRANKKAKVIKGIGIAFLTGIILICRYSAVYNLQRELTNVKTETHNLVMENENLKVEIIKASDMQKVEEIAKTKLHMVTPDKNNVIYTKAAKNYFAKDAEENKQNTKEDLIVKIKKMLF